MDLSRIELILKEQKTPFYVFFIDEFRKNYQELQAAYEGIYNRFQIAYSFKTNYMPAACKAVFKLNGYAEVVSDHEYAMAKRCGFTPERIIVNGPGKWFGLEEMLRDGAIVMLDNIFELDRALEISASLNTKPRIGFRLNFDIGTGKQSRFGFDTDKEETALAVDRARESKKLEICALHFHLGGSRSLDAWKNRAEKMIDYSERLLEKQERKIIDLGSGMFGHLHPDFAAQFHQIIPSFSDYADLVAGAFAEKYAGLPPEECPLLVVEPGSTLIADTMAYVTGVIAKKTIRGRAIAMVDGSVHQLGDLGKKKRLPIHVIRGSGNDDGIVGADISGFTCLEDDVLYRELPQMLRVGDSLVFENAGAYTNVMKPPFIRGGCKILSCTEQGEVSIIKRDETVEDLLSTYEV